MKSYVEIFSVEKMAKTLQVSKSAYYAYLHQKPSTRTLENQELLSKIKQVHAKSRCNYGSPKIHAELKRIGIRCSRPRVARLMRKASISSKTRKAWKRTTKVNKSAIAVPNRLQQNFKVDAPNKVWVSDITYVPTQEGWLYVSVSLDLFSRKVVGLGMDSSLLTPIVMKTLEQAFAHRRPGEGLMHHSDKGCQYTSDDFKSLMQKEKVELSMSGTGHCYDNAVAESFFHVLKTEHVNLCTFRTREEAKNSIFEYVEVFYNRERIHATLGYLSPVEYEMLWSNKQFSYS
jgi:putative transposase